MNLPSDLVAFLRASSELQYDVASCEVGKLKLLSLECLHVVEVYVNSMETPFEPRGAPDEEDDCAEDNSEFWDPNCCNGYYAIRAVPLIAECTRHSDPPTGVLLWYPGYDEYGQWDSEHSNALRFGNAKWSDIVQNPLRFLNAAWYWAASVRDFDWVTPWLDSQHDFRADFFCDTPVVAKDLGSISLA
ncbi:hypothetical protein [Roseimaritima ulvae]|uniref:Uncharacterized protein n=1 Tax=Roseimaritima ulvae TaxID=980254 RepID=A0A5B9QQJ7_9BACT|nr:hypothetical protein [Roseimaritima ulvae]QEG40179.1 hypothetical protein UC8_21850 [Roseimaritima ulvae]